ncbi:LCP family protein [Clostridium lacusfryxellense]|uniref:LCP family protein n=1 Tax=Clostridium lacusfryxellense TaxID=205328 RepID=UPI001C0D9F36|nr:LCP family protein [Clostridium lacusfryxellense]MBU3110765.1 LCP family protein [Clostridium lacusfryxellense]
MKKMRLWIKLVLSVIIIILLVFGATFGYTFYQLSKIKTTKISKTYEDLGIKPEVTLKKELSLKKEIPLIREEPLNKEDSNKIINIAFFGLDRREVNQQSRSDSIMILSIDEKHKKIKIVSIMRDTYVEIKNYGKTKINHAYSYGGPQLAIRTLNENFNLDIRDYVTVDFSNFEKLINAIGGVTIDVKQDEISLIPQITKPGPQILNGLQAVAYSRIRHTVGDDFRRTERQRTVLSVMLTKIQSLGVMKFPSVVSKLLPFTETSMNNMDIIKLGTNVFTSNIKTLDQKRFPVDGYWTAKMLGGVWYLVANMKATVVQLHKFIYDD